MRKLDILVPHYKEEVSVLIPMLDSLMFQRGIDLDDFGVIISHDGTDFSNEQEIWDATKLYYNFEIQEIFNEHGGVSATRNAALRESEAEYVMFCDFDDCFCNDVALNYLFSLMPFDAMNSKYFQEWREGDSVKYNLVGPDYTFCHGKIYRREYLIENNIFWNDKLTVHEDSYFNYLALTCAQDRIVNDVPVYLWKYREESVTKQEDFLFRTYDKYIDSEEALVRQLSKRDLIGEARSLAVSAILDCYYVFNHEDWFESGHEEHKERVEKRIVKFMKKYYSEFSNLNSDDIFDIASGSSRRNYQYGLIFPHFTFYEWVEKLNKKYNTRFRIGEEEDAAD